MKAIQIKSSYVENDIGTSLYEKVLEIKPKIIVEFGVLYGYSTVHMALALRELGAGKIKAYDLWEDYAYNHCKMEDTFNNLKIYEVDSFVELKKLNFFDWLEETEPFDLLHLDISNDGAIIESLFDKVKAQIDSGSVIIFEGGTAERDEIGWMKKYNKVPIENAKKKTGYEIINSKFPGLSLINKKHALPN